MEPAGSKWHIHGWFCLAGCYLLMMYYTTVAGWMLDYFAKFATGQFVGMEAGHAADAFNAMLANPVEMGIWMVVIVLAGFGRLCGGQHGPAERSGADQQMDDDRPAGPDRHFGRQQVAMMSGMIIFPACFAYGIEPDQGPSLIFITLTEVFVNMPGGRLWGSLFFVFMTFASFTTVIAVFENILVICCDCFGWERKKSCVINMVIVLVASVPCVLGYNVWSGLTFLGGKNVLDTEESPSGAGATTSTLPRPTPARGSSCPNPSGSSGICSSCCRC